MAIRPCMTFQKQCSLLHLVSRICCWFHHLTLFHFMSLSVCLSVSFILCLSASLFVSLSACLFVFSYNPPHPYRRQPAFHKLAQPRHKKSHLFFFDTSELRGEEEIVNAEMRIFKNKIKGQGFYSLKIFKVRSEGE